jgi:hypothetical protein
MLGLSHHTDKLLQAVVSVTFEVQTFSLSCRKPGTGEWMDVGNLDTDL